MRSPACSTLPPSPTAGTYREFFAFSERPPAPHTLLLEYGNLALLTCIFKLGETAVFGRLSCSGKTIEVHFQGACEEMPLTVIEGLENPSSSSFTHSFIHPLTGHSVRTTWDPQHVPGIEGTNMTKTCLVHLKH